MVDTQLYRQQAQHLGRPWLPAAGALLQEFGGLYCFFIGHDYSIGRVFLDAARAAFPELLRLLRRYSPPVPHPILCVVG